MKVWEATKSLGWAEWQSSSPTETILLRLGEVAVYVSTETNTDKENEEEIHYILNE